MEQKKKKHISQIYPCSSVETGSELYYICELGKYLALNGEILSLEGVILPKHLQQSNFWDYLRVALKNEWVTDTNITDSILEITVLSPIKSRYLQNILLFESDATKSKEMNYIKDIASKNALQNLAVCIPQLKEITFTSKTNEAWYMGILNDGSTTEYVTKLNLNTSMRNQSFVSVLAYVAIKRLLSGYPRQFMFEIKDQFFSFNQFYASDVILLESDSNALAGWALIEYADYSHDAYEAWYYKWRDRGFLNRSYTVDEKYTYATKTLGFRAGDVIFLYERQKKQCDNLLKEIKSCKLAVIEKIDKSGLVLKTLNNRRTRFGEQKVYDNYTTINKALFANTTSYKEARVRDVNLDWVSTGVDCCMYEELYFISDLNKDDTLDLEVTNGEIETTVTLEVADAVYWLLKDYSIEFNEKSFLASYFPNKTPYYKTFMGVQEEEV